MFQQLCVALKLLGVSRYTWRSFKVMKSVERLAEDERKEKEEKESLEKKEKKNSKQTEEDVEKEIIRRYRIQKWKEKELKKVSQYWIVYAAVSMWDGYADQFARYVPFYFTLKFIMLIFLFFPQLHGPEVIYKELVFPYISNKNFQHVVDTILLAMWDYTNDATDFVVSGPGKFAVATKDAVLDSYQSASESLTTYSDNTKAYLTETNEKVYNSLSKANQDIVDSFNRTIAATVAVPVSVWNSMVAFPAAVGNYVSSSTQAVKDNITSNVETAHNSVISRAQAVDETVNSTFESIGHSINSRIEATDNAIRGTWPVSYFYPDSNQETNDVIQDVENEDEVILPVINKPKKKKNRKKRAKNLLAKLGGVEDPYAFERYERQKARVAAAEKEQLEAAAAALAAATVALAAEQEAEKAPEPEQSLLRNAFERFKYIGGYFNDSDDAKQTTDKIQEDSCTDATNDEPVASKKNVRRRSILRGSLKRNSAKRSSIKRENKDKENLDGDGKQRNDKPVVSKKKAKRRSILRRSVKRNSRNLENDEQTEPEPVTTLTEAENEASKQQEQEKEKGFLERYFYFGSENQKETDANANSGWFDNINIFGP
uniref:Receptor expression-enhancing protein n=1 Tax=Aplanochytrium stocchinoi TaxID=215587 RepID=A0A7S3LQD0_9STRA